MAEIRGFLYILQQFSFTGPFQISSSHRTVHTSDKGVTKCLRYSYETKGSPTKRIVHTSSSVLIHGMSKWESNSIAFVSKTLHPKDSLWSVRTFRSYSSPFGIDVILQNILQEQEDLCPPATCLTTPTPTLNNTADPEICVDIPVAPHDRERAPRREEILLTTSSGKIFMSGLISLEDNHSILERTAGWEAYTYWLDGEFAPNRDNWRFFTGHARKIKFFSSRDRVEWAAEEAFLLVQDVEDVAIFLQQEFDKLSQQERFR